MKKSNGGLSVVGDSWVGHYLLEEGGAGASGERMSAMFALRRRGPGVLPDVWPTRIGSRTGKLSRMGSFSWHIPFNPVVFPKSSPVHVPIGEALEAKECELEQSHARQPPVAPRRARPVRGCRGACEMAFG